MSHENIKGSIISLMQDAYGEAIVAEDGNVRSLYFGDGARQSSIFLDRPDMLVEDYSRAMMSALLFMDDPASILVIGMGGCSLVNFLLKAFPECAIVVAEIRKIVIELARTFFLMPGNHSQLRIFHGDGKDLVRSGEGRGGYDLVFVDAFDEGGPAASLLEKDFFEACRRSLSSSGIFVMNVWNRPCDNFPALYWGVQEIFGGAALKLPLGEAYQNAIIFGFADRKVDRNLLGYRQTAKELQCRFNMSFQKFLRYLYWHNQETRANAL